MNIAEMLAPVGGLPEGVTEDSVREVKTGPDGVALVSVKPLPPRYEGARMLPPFTPRAFAAPDENFLSYTSGACAVIALPRVEHTRWSNNGDGWRVVSQWVRP